ncbi:hypothetical protein CBR_g45767 [Chara braunii]|uniref:Uncharacterized protein n=1 Tax=Chara braunii TaxID=69332 RepID=A0A388LZC0_CHABU|nr:hypothetical protein CBR_g45767 [Chara braunii]|eukprot:GBG87615.1 hypothetical protein CBR_g45767 [Chara braunii]
MLGPRWKGRSRDGESGEVGMEVRKRRRRGRDVGIWSGGGGAEVGMGLGREKSGWRVGRGQDGSREKEEERSGCWDMVGMGVVKRGGSKSGEGKEARGRDTLGGVEKGEVGMGIARGRSREERAIEVGIGERSETRGGRERSRDGESGEVGKGVGKRRRRGRDVRIWSGGGGAEVGMGLGREKSGWRVGRGRDGSPEEGGRGRNDGRREKSGWESGEVAMEAGRPGASLRRAGFRLPSRCVFQRRRTASASSVVDATKRRCPVGSRVRHVQAPRWWVDVSGGGWTL